MQKQYLFNEKTPLWGRFSLVEPIPLLAVLLLLCSWLVTSHFLPWVSWHAEALVFVAALISALVMTTKLIVVEKTPTAIRVPTMIWPLVFLAAVALIQGAMGVIAFWGEVLAICSYIILSIVCIGIGFGKRTDNDSNARLLSSPVLILAVTFIFAGFASTLVAFAQVLELWESSQWIVRMATTRRPGANMAQPNHLATLLVMAVASLVFLHEANKCKGFLSILLLVIFGVGLAMTGSRAGAIGFFSLLAWWFIKRSKIGSNTSQWCAVMIGAGFIVLFWLWPKFYALVQLSGPAERPLLNGGGRLTVWPQLVEALFEKPWWGWGIRQVAKAHNSVAHAYAVSEPFTYSHNLLLDLALWVGLPISFIIISSAAFWFWQRAKAANQLVTWYCLGITVPFFIHSMLEFPFAYAYFLAPVMFLLGVLEAHSNPESKISIGVKPVLGTLAVICGGFIWMAVEYVVIEEDFRIARFQTLQIGQLPKDYQQPRVILLTQLNALARATRVELQPDMRPETLVLLKNVALHFAWSATQYRYAVALALNKNSVEATRQFQVLRAQHGEELYQKVKVQLNVLAQNKYPALRELDLP